MSDQGFPRPSHGGQGQPPRSGPSKVSTYTAGNVPGVSYQGGQAHAPEEPGDPRAQGPGNAFGQGQPGGTRVMSDSPLPGDYDDRPPRPPQEPPPDKRPKRDRGRSGPGRFFRWLLVFILVIVVALGVLGWFAWSKIEKVDAIQENVESTQSDGRVYLIVGSDSREDLSDDERNELGTGSIEGKRTDTIMLLHIPTDGAPALISVPRDSMVDIPGREHERINAAYAHGGAPLLVDTLEANSGVKIDDYVEIGFGGFAGIVDALGGVEMCLDEAMQDEKAHIDLPAGCQTLNGTDALGFSRSRMTDGRGDLGRVERQREMIGEIAKKAMSPGTLINPKKLVDSAFAGGDALVLDEDTGPIDMYGFIRGMMSVTGDSGTTLTVPLGRVGNTVDWHPEEANKLWNALRNGKDIPKSVLDAQGE